MRETRLCNYGPATDDGEKTATVFISVPNATPAPPSANSHPPTWAGVINASLTWRVLDATTIQLEHLLTKTTLRLIFSAPICTRPLFQPVTREPNTHPTSTSSISLLLACFAQASGSTVLNMHIPDSLEATTANPHVVEKSRYFLPAVRVTCILPDAHEAILSLSDGMCVTMPFANPNTELKPFRMQSTGGSQFETRSTPSFMSRIFPTRSEPRVNPSALAVARVQGADRAVAILFASGRVAVFRHNGDEYVHAGECQLPCELSQNAADHFLLPRGEGSVLAVVLANEHPTTDSLRVYNVQVDFEHDDDVRVTCSHVETREGPIPRIIAAVFFSDDVVVATQSGVVTGIVNAPEPRARAAVRAESGSARSEVQTGLKKGLPSGMFWTALDDISETYGLSASMEKLEPNERNHLQKAHQFTPYAIAKALRLQDADTATSGMVQTAMAQIRVEDENAVWKKVKARVEQITKMEDMRVRDVSWDDAVGLVIARERAVYVMRPLFEVEKRLHPAWEDLLSVIQHTPCGPTAWLLSSHAVVQKLGAYFLDNVQDTRVKFTLKLVTRFSECQPDSPLTDLFCAKRAHLCPREESMSVSFTDVLAMCEQMLSPGAMLLGALLSTLEMDTLGESAEQTADELPISSMFAHGIVWLERYRRQVDGRMEDAEGIPRDASAGGEDVTNEMLQKAYGFFMFAAQACGTGAQRDDVFCAMGLAGYPCKLPSGTEMEVDDDDWQDWTIPGSSEDPAGDVVKLGDCAYWLLERVLRLMEGYCVPKTGAAAALEAMAFAPDKQKHEQMRAAAFSRFLEAGELDCALKAILSQPFRGQIVGEMNIEEADALKDCIGLFINATADRNMLNWLADQDLPEPLRMLAGQALERRARGSDILPTPSLTRDDEDVQPLCHAYEAVYAWHTLRADFSSAAACSLEWFDRLSTEGVQSVEQTFRQTDQSDNTPSAQLARTALQLCTQKQYALSLVQSALRLLPAGGRFVRRSRFVLVVGGVLECAVVSAGWVQCRLLLARAQMHYLSGFFQKCLASGESLGRGGGDWAGVLEDGPAGVEWVSIVLLAGGGAQVLRMCGELACAWREEMGDGCLTRVVEDAGRAAARRDVRGFGYADLADFLQGVGSLCAAGDGSRKGLGKGLSRGNWYVVALRSAVSTCAGRWACPQWLVDCAAFGRGECHEVGDVLAVVYVLLRNSRPVDAAKVLLTGLDRAMRDGDGEDDGGDRKECISYTAIDATLETLGQIGGDYGIADSYHKQLRTRVDEYLHMCDRRHQQRVC